MPDAGTPPENTTVLGEHAPLLYILDWNKLLNKWIKIPHFQIYQKVLPTALLSVITYLYRQQDRMEAIPQSLCRWVTGCR